MNKKTVAGVLVVAALGAIAYFSPYLTLHQMKTAVANRDADGLSRHVDFPALRENMKAQMLAAMSDHDTKKDSNPFAAMGQAIAAALVGPMVDAITTPAAVMAIMKTPVQRVDTGTAGTDADNVQEKPKLDYAMSYRSWDTVAVQLEQHGASHGSMILRRHGLWTWKVTSMELPAEALARH